MHRHTHTQSHNEMWRSLPTQVLLCGQFYSSTKRRDVDVSLTHLNMSNLTHYHLSPYSSHPDLKEYNVETVLNCFNVLYPVAISLQRVLKTRNADPNPITRHERKRVNRQMERA